VIAAALLHLNAEQWLLGLIIGGGAALLLAGRPVHGESYWNGFNLIGWLFLIAFALVFLAAVMNGDLRLLNV
jgi:hypothetical protein